MHENHICGVILKKRIPFPPPVLKLQILLINLIGIDCFSSPIYGHLNLGLQMPYGIFTPGKVNGQISLNTALFEKFDSRHGIKILNQGYPGKAAGLPNNQ